MIARYTTLLLATTAALFAEEADLLRFTNGDQFHGTFEGIGDASKINWKRSDLNEAVQFDSKKIRQIVLRKGRPLTSLTSQSHVALVNGDRFPGIISSVDGEFVTIDTEYAGSLKIPRDQVGMLAPNPLGGRISYQGPYAKDEWEMVSTPGAQNNVENPVEAAEQAEEEKDSLWNFAGAAWYWSGNKTGTALVRKDGMPDRSILRCQVSWKSRLSLAIAFHADFTRPEAEKKDEEDDQRNQRRFHPGDTGIFPELFGSSYVLHLYSNYVMLYRSSFNEAGNPVLERVQANNNSMRLADTGSALVEIRSNRQSGEIALFINDEFIVQWSEGSDEVKQTGYVGKGSGFGFLVQNGGSSTRISDIIVAEWNGMPDAARSLQVDDQDIVLLANGTDRFSGKINGLKDGKILLEGKYGGFQFPIEDIAEVRFSRKSLAKPEENPSSQIKVRLHPLGLVSGSPLAGKPGGLRLTSLGIGEWDLSLDAAVLIDFQSSTSFLDEWDPEY